MIAESNKNVMCLLMEQEGQTLYIVYERFLNISIYLILCVSKVKLCVIKLILRLLFFYILFESLGIIKKYESITKISIALI